MEGAGQWTLDHRRSLARHRKQEEEDKEKRKREEERQQKEKRQFKTGPERQVGNDSNTSRKKTANMSNSCVKFWVF